MVPGWAGVLTQHWVPLLLLLSGPTEGRFHAAEPQKHPLLPAGASFLTLNPSSAGGQGGKVDPAGWAAKPRSHTAALNSHSPIALLLSLNYSGRTACVWYL